MFIPAQVGLGLGSRGPLYWNIMYLMRLPVCFWLAWQLFIIYYLFNSVIEDNFPLSNSLVRAECCILSCFDKLNCLSPLLKAFQDQSSTCQLFNISSACISRTTDYIIWAHQILILVGLHLTSWNKDMHYWLGLSPRALVAHQKLLLLICLSRENISKEYTSIKVWVEAEKMLEQSLDWSSLDWFVVARVAYNINSVSHFAVAPTFHKYSIFPPCIFKLSSFHFAFVLSYALFRTFGASIYLRRP